MSECSVSNKWLQIDKLARAIIGPSQSDNIYEHVWRVTSAKKNDRQYYKCFPEAHVFQQTLSTMTFLDC